MVLCCRLEGSEHIVRMAMSALLEFERPVRTSSDYALLMSGPSATARVGLG